MCDDYFDDDDHEFFDDVPEPVRYYPASPPTPLVSRLMFYKAAKAYKNFRPNLTKIFTPVEREGQRKQRLLTLRLGQNYFLFKAVDYSVQREMVDVSWFGRTMHFPTNVPATLTMRLAYCGKELWHKYGQLGKAFLPNSLHHVTIAGQVFWPVHYGYESHADSEEVTVQFQMQVDANALRHDDERSKRRAPRTDFKKYVAKERCI
jgi:hypothetical protein|uniref:Uncharacterized protein n=1 Tax=Myoviridae sp. ctshb19 TaxID=2825194 RepID=A0A8S5UGQ0_9CAUD|nr:MAG TPA: hypothetical protein [Myoviridae sp. ctshb19]